MLNKSDKSLAHPEAEDQPGWGSSPLPPGWVRREDPEPREVAIALGSCSAWKGCKVIRDIRSGRGSLTWRLPRRVSLSGALQQLISLSGHCARWCCLGDPTFGAQTRAVDVRWPCSSVGHWDRAPAVPWQCCGVREKASLAPAGCS